MKHILKTRYFAKWMSKTELNDSALCKAVSEMERGLIDADLGGGAIKKRVALPGRGKSGSTRTLLATNKADRWVFVFGFEKNDRANITSKELKALQEIAKDLLAMSEHDIKACLQQGGITEIGNEHQV